MQRGGLHPGQEGVYYGTGDEEPLTDEEETEDTMNVKKMTSEQLQEVITHFDADNNSPFYGPKISQAEVEYLNACKKELARRWGIKG